MTRNALRRPALFICASVLCLAAIIPVSARFHGGAIQDIQNRIKQAIETAKQSEIYEQYKEITGIMEQMTADWGNLSTAVNHLSEDITDSFITHPSSAFLGVDNEADLKNEIRRRTAFDYLSRGEGNTGRVRKENINRLLDMHEEAFAGSIDTAAANHEMTENLYENTEELTDGLRDGSNYSVRQKQALMAANAAVSRNVKAATAAQDAMTGYERSLMDENLAAEAGAFGMEQSISVPDEDDPLYRQNIEKYRMKELPR